METTNSLINTQGLDIAKPADFAQFVQAAKELQNQLDMAWGLVEQQMIDRGVKKLTGDWGTISQAERINWKVNVNAVDPYYLKPAADTKKLRAAFEAGELPDGADFTTSVYITKRIKG